MNTYNVSVRINVKVEAFNEGDALDAVKDCFGEGDSCGLNVTNFEVVAYDES